MTILITGASGHLGSHITRHLASAGQEVRAMVYHRERAERERRLAGLPVEWVEADVTRPDSLSPAMVGAQAVVHTVAVAIEKGRASYEAINAEGTRHVVEAAQAAGVRRFVHLSQLGADAALPYRFLASKGRGEAYVRAAALDWTILRPSVFWGQEDEFANTFIRLALVTPVVFPIVGDSRARFQPVWVEDVAAAVESCLRDGATVGKSLELGGPEVLTLEEIERRALRAAGLRRVFVRAPMSLIRLAVALMEALLPNPPVTRSLLELLAVPNVVAANDLPAFVAQPRAFTPEAAAEYARGFRVGDTLQALFRR